MGSGKKKKKILAMKQRRWSNIWHYLTANLGTQVCVCVFVCARIIILGEKNYLTLSSGL